MGPLVSISVRVADNGTTRPLKSNFAGAHRVGRIGDVGSASPECSVDAPS